MNLNKYLYTEIVTVAIVVLCTIPVPEQAPMSDVPLIDKWVHMVMYGGFVFVMWMDYVVRSMQRFSWVARVAMLLYAAALGGAMELVQAYLTTCRSGDWVDFEADVVGALLGVLACMGLNRRLNTYSK